MASFLTELVRNPNRYAFSVNQNAAALYVSDEWTPFQRLTVTYGLRSDIDSVTGTTHASPRAGTWNGEFCAASVRQMPAISACR